MKIILSTVVLFALLHYASAQTQPIDTRKYFQYTDTSFEVGEVKILCCTYFTFGTSELRPGSFLSMDSLVSFLASHPRLNIEIGSNTDPNGTEKENQKLSQDRANVLMNYLIGKGIPNYRLEAKGYGETFRIYNTGEHLNRRTEIKITSISSPPQSLDSRKHFEYTDTSFEVGEVKILCCIYFNDAQISPGAILYLDSISSFLYYHPELNVEVGRYTDNKGNDKYNFKVSQAMAEGLVGYLIYKGISSDRLTAKGYGETLFIAPNETPDGKDYPAGRQLNRRTELKIVSIASPKEKFIRPSILNPPIAVIHFLFGEKTSAFPLSLFNVRAIENILDEYKPVDSSFISHYKSFARSYVGFIDAAGDSIVMAVINFSSSLPTKKNSLFDSEALGKTQTLFINLSNKSLS